MSDTTPAPILGQVVPYVVVLVDGAPPWKQASANEAERQRIASRRTLLQEKARAACGGPLLEGPLSLTIRYIRNDGDADRSNIISGVANALQGILYTDDSQLKQIEYAEHPGECERYEVGVVPAGFQVPIAFEQRGDIDIFQGDPGAMFPNDDASRWMLSLLAASHDIGLSLKLVAPFLAVPRSEIEPQRQYRVSHMLYFFRLWIAHIHEGWVAFNRRMDHEVIHQVKVAKSVKAAFRKIAEISGRKVGDVSVGEIIKQCRHSAFHYVERIGDQWENQLRLLTNPFSMRITHGDCKDVDSRWLIADEYVLSRLNRLDFGNPDLLSSMRDMALETMDLIRLTQVEYFRLRDPG